MPYADPQKRRETNRIYKRAWRARNPEKALAVSRSRQDYFNKASKLFRLRRAFKRDPIEAVNRTMKLWHAGNTSDL